MKQSNAVANETNTLIYQPPILPKPKSIQKPVVKKKGGSKKMKKPVVPEV